MVLVSLVNEDRSLLYLRGFVTVVASHNYCGCRGHGLDYKSCWEVETTIDLKKVYDITADIKLAKYESVGIMRSLKQEMILWWVRASCLKEDVASELNGICRVEW